MDLSVNAPGPKTRLRRLLDHLGAVPGFVLPHRDLEIVARDGTHLAATYFPGPAPGGPALVLAPGFAAHRRKPAYAYLAQRLSGQMAVLTMDLRGHGASGGRSTLGDREALDVRAGGAWLRREGHPWVAALGVSMGGSAVLRAAGTGPPATFDAVCAVSAPAQWGLTASRPMRAIHRMLAHGSYRRAAQRALRVRLAGRWADPAQPLDVVASITPTPLLIVHGLDDHYYGPRQARLLHGAAGQPKRLWLEPPGFGHAEDGLTGAFVERLAAALAVVHRTGRWPP